MFVIKQGASLTGETFFRIYRGAAEIENEIGTILLTSADKDLVKEFINMLKEKGLYTVTN